MAARPIASATISFGLVSVPINALFGQRVDAAGISFNWLDKKTGSRLKQQYVSAQDGRKVERDEMVKGYEFTKVASTSRSRPRSSKPLEEKASGSIDINEFVPAEQIERLYFDRAYYLGPDKGGERAYSLLAEAMNQTGRSALGQYAARGKQYLVLVRPMDGRLVMEQLHYADEIRPAAEVPIGDTEIKDAELKLAVQLIEQASSEAFRPEAYEDHVRQRILEMSSSERSRVTRSPKNPPKRQRLRS